MSDNTGGKLSDPGKVDVKHYDALEKKYADLLEESKKRTNIILGVFLVTFIVMVASVGTMILDAFHFNSAVYKEYSQKTEGLDVLLNSNQKLLETNTDLIEIYNKQQKSKEGP